MIVSFPTALWCFKVNQPIGKDMMVATFHCIGSPGLVEFMTPISLKPMDEVFVDVRTGRVEVVMRGSIAIWRADWKN